MVAGWQSDCLQRRENALVVIDAITGELIAAVGSTDVFAFFWSPNSQRIAYVSPPDETGSFSAKPSTHKIRSPELSWAILDVGERRQSGVMARSPDQSDELYMLSFYDQFGQSHRIWSPDSRHLVYSELADGVPQIMLLDTSRISCRCPSRKALSPSGVLSSVRKQYAPRLCLALAASARACRTANCPIAGRHYGDVSGSDIRRHCAVTGSMRRFRCHRER